jgi:hypothetical protein
MADKRGKFLGMPYDWRRPTKKRLKSNAWDENGKVFPPKTVGLGLRSQLSSPQETPHRALSPGRIRTLTRP